MSVSGQTWIPRTDRAHSAGLWVAILASAIVLATTPLAAQTTVLPGVEAEIGRAHV